MQYFLGAVEPRLTVTVYFSIRVATAKREVTTVRLYRNSNNSDNINDYIYIFFIFTPL